MTDPKTAARQVASRLSETSIQVKHVQALDLVAAACGFQDRSKLKDLSELPVLKRVNSGLLDSAASVLARHDLARRTTIVNVTTEVVMPKRMIDMRKLRAGGDRISDRSSEGSVSFLKMGTEALRSISQGQSTYRHGYAHYAGVSDDGVLEHISGRGPISAFLNEQVLEGPYVVAATFDDPDDLWTMFWNNEDGWVQFDSATIYADRSGELPTIGTSAPSTVRWMDVEDAAFRAAVDGAVLKMREDDEDHDHDHGMIDYDRIAAMIHVAGIFAKPLGPLTIAVRDGAQRASLYLPSLSTDPDTVGGQTREWVRDVEHAFRGGLRPDDDTLRSLLEQGEDAILGVRRWLPANEMLERWLEVSENPGLLSNEIDAQGSSVEEGIDMKPLSDVLSSLKAQFAPRNDERAMKIVNALRSARGMDGEAVRADGGIMAPCPAHDDRSPSLVVSTDGDGIVSMRCLAGCDEKAVIAAVSKTMHLQELHARDLTRSPERLEDRRYALAEEAYQNHRFEGDVVDQNGWETTSPGDRFERVVFLKRYEDDRDEIGDTVSVRFVVEFESSSDRIVSSGLEGDETPDRGRSHPAAVTLEDGLEVPFDLIEGTKGIHETPAREAILDRLTSGIWYSEWQASSDGIDRSIATEIASAAIAGLRSAKNENDREDARANAMSRLSVAVEDSEWETVGDAISSFLDDVDSSMDELVEDGILPEPIEYDRDEFESVLREAVFETLQEKDRSTWRDCLSNQDVVELYFHFVPKGNSVEETCSVNHPHLLPANVVLDDEFAFVLSRLGISVPEWTNFAKTREIDPERRTFRRRGGEPLTSAKELGVLIENGGSTSFLVSLYCQARLKDVLDLDMSKAIAFERVRLAVADVMNGTFHDHRLEGVIEMTDGKDGLLTTADCGPYASQKEDLVTSAYLSRIGTAEAVSRGPAASREMNAHLAVEGLRLLRDEERIDWREIDPRHRGSIVLQADVACRNARGDYEMRTIQAIFEDGVSERPEIEIGSRR